MRATAGTRLQAAIVVLALVSVGTPALGTHDTGDEVFELVPCAEQGGVSPDCEDEVHDNATRLAGDVRRQVNATVRTLQNETDVPLRWNENWHRPIVIDDELDFHELNGVRGGNGTPGDPYVISNWTITPMDGDPAIRISGTDAHVVIHNVTIRPLDPSDSVQEFVAGKVASSEGLDGVVLFKARNVSISDSEIRGVRYGVWIDEAHDISVRGNLVSDTDSNPIRVWKGSNLVVTGNVIPSRTATDHKEDGILVRRTETVQISDNEVRGQPEDGISVKKGERIDITWNTIVQSFDDGIDLDGGSDVLIWKNDVRKSGYQGIWSSSTTRLEVRFNNLENSDRHALDSDKPLNATNNWWGCSDGPDHHGHEQSDPDCESVSGYAAHDEMHHPYLSEPVADAGADPDEADGSEDSYLTPGV